VDFKVFTKVLTNRLTSVAHRVIQPTQMTFLPGRNFMVGVIVLHETIYDLQRKKSERCNLLSYPVFMPKPITHRMHDPGSIVPHIRPKVFTDNQMSRIEYNYCINSVSEDYDDS
jgi:hypothetical protein